MHFTEDGSMLAIADATEPIVIIWDIDKGQMAGHLHNTQVEFIAKMMLSPDGSKLAISGGLEPTVVVWDLGTNLISGEHRIDQAELLIDLLFSPDSSQLTIVSRSELQTSLELQTHLWDIERDRFLQMPSTPQTG
ncbi:MAG: WD40 repeat domain-containing protein [Chloroflexota bacterium]